MFPALLTRKQYFIRSLFVLAIVAGGFLFFVSAPQGTPVQVAGVVFPLVTLLAYLYHIFGLALPRLRNSNVSLVWLVLAVIPFGPIILFFICVSAAEKTVI
jgi:uncharacterized membrane protein YhaH (DUF805 family)